MKFAWAQGSRIKIDAQEAGERLQALRKSRKGFLKPEDVVRDARRKDSPLHGHFEWNDSEAARRWRIEQAGYLLRCITVVYDEVEETKPVRSFVRVHNPDEAEDVGYEDTRTAMSDDRLREQVIARAKMELRVWTRRYKRLNEFAEVVAAAEAVLV